MDTTVSILFLELPECCRMCWENMSNLRNDELISGLKFLHLRQGNLIESGMRYCMNSLFVSSTRLVPHPTNLPWNLLNKKIKIIKLLLYLVSELARNPSKTAGVG